MTNFSNGQSQTTNLPAYVLFNPQRNMSLCLETNLCWLRFRLAKQPDGPNTVGLEREPIDDAHGFGAG